MQSEMHSANPDREIISTRVFNVSGKKLFRAWSDPAHLQNWWGPKGFTNTFHTFDFKVGGTWRFTMHGPEKGNYENECVFMRIEEPKLIMWNRISQPLFQVWVLFEPQRDQKTLLTFKMLFETSELCAKIKPFAVDKNEENFDKLEQELALMGG